MQHKLNVAEVDCEQYKALCTSQGVTGFPMMFYYANGAKTEYTGGRSYDQLVSFSDKASNPCASFLAVVVRLSFSLQNNAGDRRTGAGTSRARQRSLVPFTPRRLRSPNRGKCLVPPQISMLPTSKNEPTAINRTTSPRVHTSS